MSEIVLNLGKPLCFFDLETTGVQVGSDKIIEICILKVNPNQSTSSPEIKTWRVNPGIPIPAESSKIHGIYDADVASKPLFKEIANEIAQFIGNADLAGYNSNKFDVPLLVEEFLRADIAFELKNRRLVDVQNIFHKMEQRTLSAASKFYLHKPLEGAHGAEADTVATYEILKAQIAKYENVPFVDKEGVEQISIQNDIDTLSKFSKMNNSVDLVGQIVLNEAGKEVFNFGKHKGMPVEEVFKKEPSYYDWMQKADFPLYTKKILTEIRLRSLNK